MQSREIIFKRGLTGSECMNYNGIKFRSSDLCREVKYMAAELKRITFTVTPDMEPLLDRAKKIFYDRTQSEMIRILISTGLDTQNTKPCEQPCEPSA